MSIRLTPDVEKTIAFMAASTGKAMRAEGISQAIMDKIAARVVNDMDAEIDDHYVHIATVAFEEKTA